MKINQEVTIMKSVNAVPITKDTNDKLDAIVKHRQKATLNTVTKKGVIGDLVDKAHKREVK